MIYVEDKERFTSPKKNRWTCKFTKGRHDFMLAIPNYIGSCNKLTVKEYYERQDARRKDDAWSKYWGRTRHYECRRCGKKAMDTVEKPDHRIHGVDNSS